MKILGQFFVVLLLSQISWADPNALPDSFEEADFIYRKVLSSLFDMDEGLAKLGVKAYACRLENGPSSVSYRGIGPCVYESAKFTFKTHRASTISLWVLNEHGQYLPPLKMEWRHSQSGWIPFGSEFLSLARDANRKKPNQKRHKRNSKFEEDCSQARSIENDLGNFIGDLTIVLPPGRKVSEYFVVKALDGMDIRTISVNAKMPFVINRKRTYKISGTLINQQSETIQISVLTNYNLVTHRDYCANGSLNAAGNLPLMLVKP